MLKKNDEKIFLGSQDPRLENYAVCLKMIFHDLSDLNSKEVDKILDHYQVAIAPNDRVSITLPRLVRGK